MQPTQGDIETTKSDTIGHSGDTIGRSGDTKRPHRRSSRSRRPALTNLPCGHRRVDAGVCSQICLADEDAFTTRRAAARRHGHNAWEYLSASGGSDLHDARSAR